MKTSAERKALIAELERHRHQVAVDLDGLNDSLDVGQRFEESVRRHPGWWIGGGIAAGMILSRVLLPGRRGNRGKGGEESAGLAGGPAFLGLMGFAAKEILRLSTPALKEAAGQYLEQWISQRRSPVDDNDAPPNPSNEESS